ncbi:MAG: 6-phosphogluconolactonase [Acidobacteriota bacterium]|jgi:6-phosphogluconolactonase|nr:6-phosphogluconolactonase [Acidobacteriota bacterium]
METPEEISKVRIFEDAAGVAEAAANRFIELAQEAIAERGRFTVALAGGSTPQRAYRLLASEHYRQRLDWSQVHIFFGDERSVPPDDAESNYRMANEALLSHVDLPAENIHRMNGVGDVVANARLYEDELRTFFNDAAWPRFDLVLLGMGDDGHTASLFPGTEVLAEQEAWVAGVWVEKLSAYRITLTALAINHAAHIIFLVTGENKAQPLREILEGKQTSEQLPAQLIKPLDGSLEWFVDRAASAQLNETGL